MYNQKKFKYDSKGSTDKACFFLLEVVADQVLFGIVTELSDVGKEEVTWELKNKIPNVISVPYPVRKH